MPRTNHTGDIGNGRCVPATSPRPHQQHVDPLMPPPKLALDDAQATLDRYREIESEVRRRFALLIWRGTLDAADDESSEPIAQRAIGTYLAHAALLAEIATKLQLECCQNVPLGEPSEGMIASTRQSSPCRCFSPRLAES